MEPSHQHRRTSASSKQAPAQDSTAVLRSLYESEGSSRYENVVDDDQMMLLRRRSELEIAAAEMRGQPSRDEGAQGKVQDQKVSIANRYDENKRKTYEDLYSRQFRVYPDGSRELTEVVKEAGPEQQKYDGMGRKQIIPEEVPSFPIPHSVVVPKYRYERTGMGPERVSSRTVASPDGSISFSDYRGPYFIYTGGGKADLFDPDSIVKTPTPNPTPLYTERFDAKKGTLVEETYRPQGQLKRRETVYKDGSITDEMYRKNGQLKERASVSPDGVRNVQEYDTQGKPVDEQGKPIPPKQAPAHQRRKLQRSTAHLSSAATDAAGYAATHPAGSAQQTTTPQPERGEHELPQTD